MPAERVPLRAALDTAIGRGEGGKVRDLPLVPRGAAMGTRMFARLHHRQPIRECGVRRGRGLAPACRCAPRARGVRRGVGLPPAPASVGGAAIFITVKDEAAVVSLICVPCAPAGLECRDPPQGTDAFHGGARGSLLGPALFAGGPGRVCGLGGRQPTTAPVLL